MKLSAQIVASLLFLSVVSAGATAAPTGTKLSGAALDQSLSSRPPSTGLVADKCFTGHWTGAVYLSLAAIPTSLRQNHFDTGSRFEEQYLAKVLGSDASFARSRDEDMDVHSLELLARKAFHTVDVNDDCYLSNGELTAVSHATQGPDRVEGPTLQSAISDLAKSGVLSASMLPPPEGVADKCFTGDWSGEVYPSPADIPEAFRSLLEFKRTNYEIDLIAKALRIIHDDENPAKYSIDQLDLNVAKNDRVTIRNMLREQTFDALDTDKDGTVTRDDLVKLFSKRNADPEGAERSATMFLKLYDRNGDSVITKAEMRFDPKTDDSPERLSLERSAGFQHYYLPIEDRLKSLTEFLSLAQPDSGKLTARDIELLTRKVFHTIDTDGDCVISDKEYTAAKDPAYVRAHTVTDADLKDLQTKASNGDAAAQYRLGLLHIRGEGVPKDWKQTDKWWRAAAQQGHPGAEYGLGMLYYEGQGASPDYAEAAKWHRIAAEHGNVMSAGVLSTLYSQGKGVEKSEAKAAAWERYAAERGDAIEQFDLGRSYERGEGVTQDWSEAYFWLLLASRNQEGSGIRVGNDPRDNAAKHLSAEQVSTVMKRAHEWRPTAGPPPEP